MKTLFFLFFFSIMIYPDPQPEFYFHINDSEFDHTYYIGAQKVGVDPLYIWDNST